MSCLLYTSQRALSDAGISASELGQVLLVGGSTRIPAVQEEVKRLTGKEPSLSLIHIYAVMKLFARHLNTSGYGFFLMQRNTIIGFMINATNAILPTCLLYTSIIREIN